MNLVVWDALGTLLDLEPVRKPFAEAGVPHGLEAWFGRILHTGAALTLAGEFEPFAAVAESTLPATLTQLGLPPDDPRPLDALRHDLRPVEEAATALDVLDEAGIPSWILTNGSRESTEQALARGGLDGRFAGIVSIDDAGAWKPHPAPYELLLERARTAAQDCRFVAAHGWDVNAARRHGFVPVWVEQLEQRWPLPTPPPELRASDPAAAARLVASG